MILSTELITGALSRVSEETAGEKNIPGIMLEILDDTINVCYSDTHKAYIEPIEILREEGDITGKIVLPFDSFTRAISNCQPSGSIKVRNIQIKFSDKILKMTATQERVVSNGETEDYVKMATKTMDIPYTVVNENASQQAKILDRMDYKGIFQSVNADKWDRKKLAETLATTSTEKSKLIYMSSKIQKVYVANTAYTCSVVVDKEFEPTEEDLNTLKNQLESESRGDEYEVESAKLGNRMKNSLVLPSNMASVLSKILNKLPATYEEVYVNTKDGYMCVFTPDEKIGVHLETGKGSKMSVEAFERFVNFDYTRFQLNLFTEFLADSIKSAVNSTKGEKTTFRFEKSKEDVNKIDLVIVSSNSNASVSDTYRVAIDNILGDKEALIGTTVTVSLKVFAEMLKAIKSDVTALDISAETNGQICMRLAELDYDRASKEWAKARTKLGLPLEPVLDQPMPETPDEVKAGYRADTLGTCMYSMVTK